MASVDHKVQDVHQVLQVAGSPWFAIEREIYARTGEPGSRDQVFVGATISSMWADHIVELHNLLVS